jgi:hypothetical protein
MFPLPGGYANVCDSQDAEEHGYSKRNLGKNKFSILYRKTWSKKNFLKWVRNSIQKYMYNIYVKIVREHKQL